MTYQDLYAIYGAGPLTQAERRRIEARAVARYALRTAPEQPTVSTASAGA